VAQIGATSGADGVSRHRLAQQVVLMVSAAFPTTGSKPPVTSDTTTEVVKSL